MERYHVVVVVVCLVACQAVFAEDEATLYRLLFGPQSRYNNHVRPKLDAHETVHVSIHMEIKRIQELDERDQVLQMVGFFTANWYDDFIKWDPDAYGNITVVVIEPQYVWLPDFGISNCVDSFYPDKFTDSFRVQVHNTGRVTWSFGGIFRTICQLDHTFYPVDKQHCEIELENWAYTGDQVDLHHATDQVVLDNKLSHGLWSASSGGVSKRIHEYVSHPGEKYPELVFSMNMSRKSAYYVMNIMVPCGFIVVVALAVFWIPPDAGEKLSFGVTVLLAFYVFQLVIAEQTPVNSDSRPKITLMVLTIMGLSSISVVTSCIVLYIHHKSTATRVPRWLRRFSFRMMATVMCMRSGMPEVDDDEGKVCPDAVTMVGTKELKEKTLDNSQVKGNEELNEILENLRFMTQNMKDKIKDNRVLEEWRALGRVIDRFLFWASCSVIVIMGMFLLRSMPDEARPI